MISEIVKSVAENIKKLISTKASIKHAIELKNVPINDSTVFENYADKILEIEEGDIFSENYKIYKTILNGSYTDATSFFYGSSVVNLDLSNWDTKYITDMNAMFNFCEQLETLNVSGWNTARVQDMSYMFSGCSSLKTLDLSSFDTSSISSKDYIDSMFSNCESLEVLDISNFCVHDHRYFSDSIFQNCNSLHTLRMDNCDSATIYSLLTDGNFPTNKIEGVTRCIYCREESISFDITAPENWNFIYI